MGSLRWLAAGANRRLRNLKPEQLWLLLLRATLLAVLAVAVAEPVWRQQQPASRGQVLLSPEVLGTPALAALRPTLDSLRRRGYAVRSLAAGFARLPRAAWRTDSAGRPARAMAGMKTGSDSAAAFAWARVQQASAAFPGQPLFVVTPASLRYFQGTHPPLPAAVTWQALPVTTTTTWVQAAALRADSLLLLLGYSTETRTTFRLVSVARPQLGVPLRAPGLPPLQLVRKAAAIQLRPLDAAGGVAADTSQPIPVRTLPLRIIIYATASYATDARYLQAGLRAAAAGLPIPLALTTTAQAPTSASRPDWLFWLSDAPVPAAWQTATNQGTNIWQESAGPGVTDTAAFAINEASAVAVAVFRRSVAAPSAAAVPLWSDGLGRAILTQSARGQGAFYQLHTRLNPAWSELADNALFPARLLALLQPETPPNHHLAAHDQRALDPAQLSGARPALPTATTSEPIVSPVSRFTDLRPGLVLAAGLLFLLERLLAHRREARALALPTTS